MLRKLILCALASAAIKFTVRQMNPLQSFSSRPCDAKPNELFRPTTIHWGLRAKR